MDNKLLIVDDEDGIRKVLSIALSDSGYTVFTAQNGEEALDIFRRENPPIVLTDIKMPGMDGLATLSEIKKLGLFTETLILTGHGSESQETLAGELGAWLQDGRDLALLVGGPEGLGEAAREAASQRWSLSPLTLPHPLVRVLIAEQLYRAWSILRNHPYHRA